MKANRTTPPRRTSKVALAAAAVIVLSATAPAGDPCDDVALGARSAAYASAEADLFTAWANAQNIEDPADRDAAIDEAYSDYFEAVDLADAQHELRLGLCSRLGGGRYAPDINPADFVPLVDNPLLPFLPGATWEYEKVLPGGELEGVEITVLTETREILGVACTTVRDIAREDGEIVEETLDYFAQDTAGNVWYFGEISMNFEDGYLVDVDGSWISGEDEAQPGIVMWATPEIGRTYRQEFLLGEAEDAGLVSSIGATVTVPAGTFQGCVETFDFTPLEPDAQEEKIYAPGVGLVLEIDRVTGERLELITHTP